MAGSPVVVYGRRPWGVGEPVDTPDPSKNLTYTPLA